jgi:N-acetylglucosaminyldiphosphoundecaprenol N-acetyl-beta-D-mannosaminyltransferase
MERLSRGVSSRRRISAMYRSARMSRSPEPRVLTRGSAGEGFPPVPSADVLGIRVDATSYEDAAGRIVEWAREGRSASVCAAAVNNLMEAHDHPPFRLVMRRADLVAPDGMPLVWALRLLGVRSASRVAGTDLVPRVLRLAAATGTPVGFFGSTSEVLTDLRSWAETLFPGLVVSFAYDPPFRAWSQEEEERVLREVTESETRILFVGLGCPKQEIWMDRVRGRVPAVMVGVGAAFDFLSGRKRRAPVLFQRVGLEWMFRLASEPQRLWRRYVLNNPRFVVLFARQMLQDRLSRRGGWHTGGFARKERS